jgi:hypothetical protein
MTHPGVGSLTALAYVLIIGTPERFLSLPIIPSVLKSLLLGFLAVILSPHENHVFRPDSSLAVMSAESSRSTSREYCPTPPDYGTAA